MSQTRKLSALESIVNVAIGYTVAVCLQLLVFPLFGWNPSLENNLAIAAIFTAVSLVRSYLIRRMFNVFGGVG